MSRLHLRSLLLAVSVLTAAPLLYAQEPNPIPPSFHSIYPQPSVAHAEVDQAIRLASLQHKRLILDFGTDDCPDCQALAQFFSTRINRDQVAAHFLIVHIDVGKQANRNLDLAHRFHAPVTPGNMPILCVVDGQGHILQTDTEFNRARNRSANDLTVFLNKARG